MKIGDILYEFKAKPPVGDNPEVLTLTEHNGFVRQSDKFTKRLATDDVSGYKFIGRDDFAFNPYLLWAGALARNDRFDAGVISPLYPTFRVRPGFDPAYVIRILLADSSIKRYDSIAFGSVPRRRRSSVKDFLSLDIPALPPLDEQRRITAVLDKADALRLKCREVIAHLDALSQSIFDSVATSYTGQKTALGDVAKVGTGGTPSRTVEGNFGGSIPWVKTGEVQMGIIYETEELITERALATSSCRVYPAGSVIVAMYGQGQTRGRSAILGTQAATNQACAVIQPTNALDNDFLFYQLRWSYKRLRKMGRGGNQENLNLAMIRSFPLIVPPIDVQQEFTSRVAVVENLKTANQARLGALENLFLSLQNRAFKGEL